ncbi:uncharacterized protein LOC119375497 isoform X2 [Rhipicephalus sanguineus]|uniref:Uncharacterized protein n=1 Tax=Rhipicephalus sanguineus TaxID=34632 RepID=A0A9D4Q8N2_RHISA|nr:uncharacterized protein LOC119375497 isoform X2 [Rhipicephalus sanguineus]KAH7971905.1 hypothetical protein HPB52_003670 [Rhipicephalus sanguineus]
MDETSKCCEKKNGRRDGGGGRSGAQAAATSTTYGSMEVADNPVLGPSEQAPDMRAGGDSKDIELHTSLTREDSIVWDPKPCNCVADGPKCRECMASGKSTVKVQMESWSVEKTVIFGIILGAFFIWAVVFGICLNVFKL